MLQTNPDCIALMKWEYYKEEAYPDSQRKWWEPEFFCRKYVRNYLFTARLGEWEASKTKYIFFKETIIWISEICYEQTGKA